MKTYREPSREIPVIRETDVVVVGGGPAGLTAAIACARNGARTVLVEQFGFLGGTATASLMACINGFRNQKEPDSTQVVRGIAEEIVLLLKQDGGLGISPYEQKSYPTTPGSMEYSYAIDVEKFKYATLKLTVESKVELMLHTFFCAPIVEGSGVRGIVVENKSGRQAILANIVVDASGDADVAARCGVPFWQTRKDEAQRLNDGIMYKIEFGSKRPPGKYSCDFGRHAVVWGPGTGPINGVDAEELTRAEIETRLKVFEDFDARRKICPELADARVIETPVMLGIRQTRFIKGEYTLTAQDAIHGRNFPDTIAISACPIIAYYGYRRFLEHEGFGIPYRCMLPQKIENMLVTGRCISSEQEPYESYRAMIPIMAIGQAAGTAAALCIRSKTAPRDLDAQQLQKTLVSQNAVITRKGW